jgi:hypothetical protein
MVTEPCVAPNALADYLRDLAAAGFYGTISLRFDRGRLVHILRQESILPAALTTPKPPKRNSNPGDHDENN